MAEHLYLRLAESGSIEDPVIHLEWMLLDETSGIVRFRGEGGLDDFRDLATDLSFTGKTHVMIPSEDVLLTQASVPTKQPKQILQAVPYIIEEQLASDVEQCHFAIGSRSDAGDVSVGVIDQGRMQYWHSVVKTLGVTPHFMTADVLALPGSLSCAVMVDGERSLLRIGKQQGISIHSSLIATTIGLLPDDQKSQIRVYVAANDEEMVNLQINQLNAELESPVEVMSLEYAPFESLCRQLDSGALNLLQGEFKADTKEASSSGNWRSIAILAACAFLLHLFLVLGQGVYLDIQAQKLEQQARTLYADIYPGDRNVRDMRRRWQNHLRSGGGVTGEFMTLFVETSKNIPGANLTLNNVNYNDSRGDLVLQLEANQSEQLISFADTLNKLGLEAEIGTINQGEGAVKGSVKVKSVGGR